MAEQPPKQNKPKILDIASGDPMGDVHREIEQMQNQVQNAVKSAVQPLLGWLAPLKQMLGMAPEMQAAPVAAAPATAPLAAVTWSDMLRLNVIFADNTETPMYSMPQTMGTGQLSKAQEQMATETALAAIRECAVYAAEFPAPTTGPYAGQAIKGIMELVTNDDLQAFLRFVKAFPAKYVGKTWKISETFTTWLINNSPAPN